MNIFFRCGHAAQIRDVARYRKSLLVVMEIERAEGVARLLR